MGTQIIKHQLEYSMYSCKVSWCSVCNQHFYDDRNKEHTTLATEEHYHIVEEKQPYADHCEKIAIAFKEWQGNEWEQYDGFDRWINTHTMEVVGTNELYKRFSKQK